MSHIRLPAGYFEDMYAKDPDPWGFTTRWYEQRKRALTLAALPKARYRRAIEPGCSIGTLSEQLAVRCDHLVCTDISDRALDLARRRLAARPGSPSGTVEFRRWGLGDTWPGELFDLIVLSEVCYYLDADPLRAAFRDAARCLEPGGTMICVHWRHEVPQYPLSGDEVHRIAADTPGLTRLAGYSDEDLLLDVFTAGGRRPVSVARSEGLTPEEKD
ncbi:class I SAM-dependent DNA methyltransferase [Nocardia alni]|uniref:class I SAM-dependent DNA methyltransferase n=1 Tax=Nocardia alni TaxID=2815723 RepID=UPI0027DF9217|nr:class I SAM-dependent methyltransferase [Nocardia alni]